MCRRTVLFVRVRRAKCSVCWANWVVEGDTSLRIHRRGIDGLKGKWVTLSFSKSGFSSVLQSASVSCARGQTCLKEIFVWILHHDSDKIVEEPTMARRRCTASKVDLFCTFSTLQ